MLASAPLASNHGSSKGAHATDTRTVSAVGGRRRLPLVSVENFRVPRRRRTTDDAQAVVPDEAKEV